jgi:hypothetical protein
MFIIQVIYNKQFFFNTRIKLRNKLCNKQIKYKISVNDLDLQRKND